MSSISEYLRTRGLSLDPVEVDTDPIMESEQLINEAGELWEGKKNLITMVLQARINAIAKQILEKAQPEEVLVLRQSLVELGAIVTDFEKYKGESLRRKAATSNEDNTLSAEPVQPEEGKEGSL